jgi:hypothetical protein
MLTAQNHNSSDQYAVAAPAIDAQRTIVSLRATTRTLAYSAIEPRSTERIAAPMNSRLRFTALCLAALFAILMLVSVPASAAPPLVGTYKITENTDLGSEVRITVLLNLVNPGDTAVTVTRVSLRSISAPGQLVSANTNTIVESHANSQFSLQFLIAKKDFTVWQIGPHQQFLVTLQPTGGKITLVNVPLLRTQG